jgi:hypothetical protein
LLLILCVGALAQTPRQKAQAIVAQMTQTEKLAMVHGYPKYITLIFYGCLQSFSSDY